MPTASDIRSELRAFLDDAPEGTHKQGLFWSDAELNAALTAAQWTIFSFLAAKKQSYLLQRLVTSVTATSNTSVPADYAFSISGEIQPSGSAHYRQARLYIGWTNRNYIYASNQYMAAVAGSTVEWWRNGITAGVAGRLWYYKKPTAFDTATSHTDFDDRVYDPIVYLATAILQLKDDGEVSRSVNRYRRAMKDLISEPTDQYPQLHETTP